MQFIDTHLASFRASDYIESHGYTDLVVSMLEVVLNKAENADANTIIEAVTQMVSEQTGEKIMTAAEQMRQEAAQRAVQKEKHIIASNLLREHIDIAVVAKTTHLSLEELKKLKKEIEDTKH